MKHRIITVPKDKIAENALDFDEATSEQLIELILTEEDFYFLYQNGIFELINEKGGANIDDYEDDAVTEPDRIVNVINALGLHKDMNNQLIQNISCLFREALSRGTGVYFFF